MHKNAPLGMSKPRAFPPLPEAPRPRWVALTVPVPGVPRPIGAETRSPPDSKGWCPCPALCGDLVGTLSVPAPRGSDQRGCGPPTGRQLVAEDGAVTGSSPVLQAVT